MKIYAKTMKIAFFTDTYFPQLNGVTISIDNFTQQLRRQGHTVYIFAPKIRGYKDSDSHVFRLSSFKVINSEPEARAPLLLPQKSLREAFRGDFDLIHGHGNGAFSFLGLQIARIKRVPYVLTFHTLHNKYTHYIFKGKLIRPKMVESGFRVFGNLCDGIVTPSLKMKNELVGYGVKKPIKVVPNFIDFSLFKAKDETYLRSRLQLGAEERILLSVGRLGKEKNFDFLLRVFKKLAHSHQKTHLVIVGQGLEKENLEELARKLGVDRRVHFTGRIPYEEMPLVYSGADIFVFASETETQGVCVLEAAAAGLPVVAVKDAAFQNIIVKGENGFLLPLQEEKFVEKISLILNDPHLQREFSENSVKIAQQNFDPVRITHKLITFYRQTQQQHDQRKRIVSRLIDITALNKLMKATEALNRFIST